MAYLIVEVMSVGRALAIEELLPLHHIRNQIVSMTSRPGDTDNHGWIGNCWIQLSTIWRSIGVVFAYRLVS